MNKIVFSNGEIFDSCSYPVEIEPPIFSKQMLVNGINRDYLRITINNTTYEKVKANFVNNATYAIRQFDLDESGNELTTYTDFDWSAYSVAGEIVDHRDGRFTVYMAKPNNYETAVDNLIADSIMADEIEA